MRKEKKNQKSREYGYMIQQLVQVADIDVNEIAELKKLNISWTTLLQ